MNRCNLNQQSNEPNNNFIIHKRRFLTPERLRSIQSNHPTLKKSILYTKNHKTPYNNKCSFNIKGQSKSWAHMSTQLPNDDTIDASHKSKSTRLLKRQHSQSSQKSKLQVLSTLLAGIKVRYYNAKPSDIYSRSNLLKNKTQQTEEELKALWYKPSKITTKKQQRKYKLLQMEGIHYKFKSIKGLQFSTPKKTNKISFTQRNHQLT